MKDLQTLDILPIFATNLFVDSDTFLVMELQ